MTVGVLCATSSLTSATGTVSDIQLSASHTPTLLDTGVQATLGTGGRLASSLASSGATTTYQYDQYGRRTAEASSDPLVEARSYGYDVFGHLTDSTVGSLAASYTTTQGLRSSQTVGETTTDYVWDVFAGVPTLLEDGAHAYVYATGSSPVAQVDLATGDVEYLHGDLTGSTRAVTDASGAVVGTWDFTAYGEVASSTGGAGATRFLFSGEYRDDSGLYYLRARSYDPATGQFLTVDPALASTGMAYAYTAGDPLQQVDPMGLDSSDSGGGQSVVGGIGNGVKSLGSGIAYGVNPWHWDDIKQSMQCAAEANGGGWGGWFTAVNVTVNPMYAVIDNGDLAIQAGKDGRWGDAAEHGTVSLGILAMTVAPLKIPIPKILEATLGAAMRVMEKVHLPATAIEVLKGTAAAVGKAGAAVDRAVGAGIERLSGPANSIASNGVTLSLRYKAGWSAVQRAAADAKVDALNESSMVVTPARRSGTSAAQRYRADGQTVPRGMDVDHVQDLQLGGADAVWNMNPLDYSVNRSLGVQIANQIRGLPLGTIIRRVSIS